MGRKELRTGPAGERGKLKRERGFKPVPNEGRDNCFVLLGALRQREGVEMTCHTWFLDEVGKGRGGGM